MDLCKVPWCFYGTKKAYPFLFSISNFSHCFVYSGVLVYDHLYVNMKNEDKVLIDVLLENHGGLAFVRARVKEGEFMP